MPTRKRLCTTTTSGIAMTLRQGAIANPILLAWCFLDTWDLEISVLWASHTLKSPTCSLVMSHDITTCIAMRATVRRCYLICVGCLPEIQTNVRQRVALSASDRLAAGATTDAARRRRLEF